MTLTPFRYHVMLKPRGAVCNLDCAYCYYLSKEALFPESRFRMSEALLESFTRQYLASQPDGPVSFAWQGGEPTLMGLPFFEHAVELQQRYRRPGQRVENVLQTNATTLDAAWCRFLKAHDFLLGVSLDGPRTLHDVYRIDKGGSPTFDRVMAAVDLIKAHDLRFNVLCCVNHANAAHPLDVYRFLRDEVEAEFIQFIPVVERLSTAGLPESELVSDRSVRPEAFGRFLLAVFEEWVRRDVGRVYVQHFDVTLGAWLGQPGGLCVHAPTCGNALALEHNGDLFSCDHFVEAGFHLGNIGAGNLAALVVSDRQRAFGQAKSDALPDACRACDLRFACQGGCPKDRFVRSADAGPGLNYLCAGYLLFFTSTAPAMRFMAEQLRQGQAPALVMGWQARRDAALQQGLAAAGRNDPCPCGSGRKLKHCHGLSASEPTV